MAIIEVCVVPLGTSTTSVSQYVAGCVKVLERERVNYQLTPMGTILEGDLEHLLKVVRMMHEQPFNEGMSRVTTTIRIDDRRDKEVTMGAKVSSIQEKL